MTNQKLRVVNQALGKQVSIGPFRVNQLIPCFFALLVVSWLTINGFISIFGALFLGAGLIIAIMILFNDRSWLLIAKFKSVPYIVRGCIYYHSLLDGRQIFLKVDRYR